MDDDHKIDEAIIPGLPDDLALMCLAKISHGYHGLLECVSRKWRRMVRSMDYANLKAKKGWSGDWLFACNHLGRQSTWIAYDPDADRWHPLPAFPMGKYDSVTACSCVSVCKRFLVIGGCYSKSMRGNLGAKNVVMFDPFKQQWKIVSRMRRRRANFACAVIRDKVYVAGGINSSATGGISDAEVYDPHLDRWEDLPPMPFRLLECISVSYGDEFHVVGKKASNYEYNIHVIFNPLDQKWRIAEVGPLSKLQREYTTVANGQIYSVLDDDGIRVKDADTKDWHTIGTFPAIVHPGHVRPLKPFGFTFVGFKKCLYFLGGMALRFDSDSRSYDVVDLSNVRYFDPEKMPLEWHDARPMPNTSGNVIVGVLDED